MATWWVRGWGVGRHRGREAVAACAIALAFGAGPACEVRPSGGPLVSAQVKPPWLPSGAIVTDGPHGKGSDFQLGFRVDGVVPEKVADELEQHYQEWNRTATAKGPGWEPWAWHATPAGGIIELDSSGSPVNRSSRIWFGAWTDSGGTVASYTLTSAQADTGIVVMGFATVAEKAK